MIDVLTLIITQPRQRCDLQKNSIQVGLFWVENSQRQRGRGIFTQFYLFLMFHLLHLPYLPNT